MAPSRVLLLNADDLLVGVADQGLLVVGDDHVVDADGETGAGGETEAQRFDLVEHLDGGFEAEPQVAVVDQLTNALLLEQAVDVRHTLGQMVVEDRAADRRVQEFALMLNRVGMRDVLIVISRP